VGGKWISDGMVGGGCWMVVSGYSMLAHYKEEDDKGVTGNTIKASVPKGVIDSARLQAQKKCLAFDGRRVSRFSLPLRRISFLMNLQKSITNAAFLFTLNNAVRVIGH